MVQFSIVSHDGSTLIVNQWLSKGPPRGVIQLAHGAAEHLGRYGRLAMFLTEKGYTVLGADHRGHGANVGIHGLGDFGPSGFAGIIEDMKAVTQFAKTEFPDLPVILLAHSFGSFAAQVYLAKHAKLLDGLILSGTAAVNLLLASADPGGQMTSANARFEPARTPFDWLSRDHDEVDAYIADPLCGFELTPHSLMSMVALVGDLEEFRDLAAATSKNLPIYIISGEHDPIVGLGQCLSRALVDRLQRAGLSDVQHRIYEGGRHEMFNEINREEVTRDLGLWLDSRFRLP